ncbi:MAG: DUF1214 domain-containing protein [Methyloligellaceae bacterium]
MKAVRSVVSLLLAFACALGIGLASAWYLIAHGSPLTTGEIGPWSVWYTAGNPNADPYTKAYLARSGRLPITSTNALYYFASTDEDGEPLRAECIYRIEGVPLNAMWWSLALYDEAGNLIPNKAERHAFNRADLMRRPDGTFQIRLAPTAEHGNWLPTGKPGGLRIILRIYGPYEPTSAVRGREIENSLPEILKVACP